MPLIGHLAELRHRLVVVVLSLIVAAGIAFFFSHHIYQWLQKPLMLALPERSRFITLSPVEGWLVYFKVSLFTALFVISPI